PRAVFALKNMNCLQPVNALFGVLGQIVIGVVHVDVLRVAAAGWQFDREQCRGLGRARVVGVVGVECLARDDASTVVELVVGNIVHAGMAGDMALLLIVRLK